MRKHSSKSTTGRSSHHDPLGDYPARFLQHLEGQHYARATLLEYQRCLRALADYTREKRIKTAPLDEADARHLARGYGARRRRHTIFIIKQFNRFLIDAGAVRLPETLRDDGPLARLRSEYEDYLRVQRGLSERSIYHCWRFADRFIAFRFGGKVPDWSQIAARDLARFMLNLASRRNKAPPTQLRNFFQFLFRSGKIKTNLALSIPRVAPRHTSDLPKYLTAGEVERVIAAVKEDTPVSRLRNYAMVLLQARLGLRAREVIAIELNDINWRAGELLVRGKGGLQDRLPLPQDVGEAITNYIRHDRKTASRTLFVTNQAPRVAFADAHILNKVLKKAFRKAGVEPQRRYVGSHILRHSLAVNMVRNGASLAEIGDMLRHRSRRSTMIYTKLDIESLRSVAREWPMAGGAQ